MSQENVERLRPLYEAWRRGAYGEGLEVLDEQVEWSAAAAIPGHLGISRGRVAATRFLAEWRAMWETYSVEVERFIDLGDDVLRRWLWAFENDADAFQDILHPDIAWFQIEEDRSPIYGIAAAVEARRRWLDTWDEHRLDLEEVIEGGDSVAAAIHITARGKASGVEVDIRFYAEVKVQDDKVIYIYDHEDRATALEAVGLSE